MTDGSELDDELLDPALRRKIELSENLLQTYKLGLEEMARVADVAVEHMRARIGPCDPKSAKGVFLSGYEALARQLRSDLNRVNWDKEKMRLDAAVIARTLREDEENKEGG